jgi:hypothetical protein
MIIGLTLLISLIPKVKYRKSFEKTITNFAIIPKYFSGLLSKMIFIAEFAIIVLLIIGYKLQFYGFIFGSALFLVYSIALISVLARGINTSCNCFGPDNQNVSKFHVFRSIIFLCICFLGLVLTFGNESVLFPIPFFVIIILFICAYLIQLFIVEIRDITRLFKN